MQEIRSLFRALALAATFLLPFYHATGVSADELTAQEIVKRADDLLRGDTYQGTYVMTVITPSWQRRLELAVWGKGRDRMCIRVLAPAKEAGICTLRIGANMWNYLPTVERTIKIPPSMMLQPWMGSDFTNDDLVHESSVVHDYTHTILGEEIQDGSPAYQIELRPLPQAPVTWGKLIFWIRKDDQVPLREEYYSQSLQLIKVLAYSKIQPMSDRTIPTLWEASTVTKPGHRTTIELVDVVYNQPIDEAIFSLANVSRTR